MLYLEEIDTVNNFDENNLTDEEVQHLLHVLKHPSHLLDLKKLTNALISLTSDEIDETKSIIDEIDGIEYWLHFYCGDPLLLKPKYSIHLRFKKSNIHLIRVDIGSAHRNPGQKRSREPHMHIYTNRFKKHDTIAQPIPINDFPNIKSMVACLESFLQYTNTHS
jgi:hypothetical protein